MTLAHWIVLYLFVGVLETMLAVSLKYDEPEKWPVHVLFWPITIVAVIFYVVVYGVYFPVTRFFKWFGDLSK